MKTETDIGRDGNSPSRRSRKTRSDGERSRQTILRVAADLATTIGLEGLSIGVLASATGFSKGGISAHFPTKESLQLATIDTALQIFGHEVLEPAEAEEPGTARLRSICENDLSYIERLVFPGGCFFSAVAAEFCARGGPVRERIVESNRWWMDLLEQTALEAQQRGEFRASIDPAQLAFELNGVIVSANFAFMLHNDPRALERARILIRERIDQAMAE